MGLSAGSEMKSSWTRVALNPVTGVLLRERRDTQAQRSSHVDTELHLRAVPRLSVAA